MTTYFTATIDMPEVAREIVSDNGYDELFNELAERFDTRQEVLEALKKHCGADLDDNGKNFLLAIADFVAEQFPGERIPATTNRDNHAMADDDDMRDFYASGMRFHAKTELDNDIGQDGQFGVTTDDHGAWKKVKGKWSKIGIYNRLVAD